MLGAMIFLGALFAMNGIVANDRKQGFSASCSPSRSTPSRYYGQAFSCTGRASWRDDAARPAVRR
jgi:hypothetical protein